MLLNELRYRPELFNVLRHCAHPRTSPPRTSPSVTRRSISWSVFYFFFGSRFNINNRGKQHTGYQSLDPLDVEDSCYGRRGYSRGVVVIPRIGLAVALPTGCVIVLRAFLWVLGFWVLGACLVSALLSR